MSQDKKGETKPLPAVKTVGRWEHTIPPAMWGASILLVFGLPLIAFHSFLAFHLLAEMVSITVSMMLAGLAWHAYPFSRRHYAIFLGAGFVWVALFDLLHTLSYKGMDVLYVSGANLPTQFWVSGRYLEVLVLLTATVSVGRSVSPFRIFAAFTLLASLLLASIFLDVFPTMYVDGQGLTPAKVNSEYLIIGLLLLVLLIQHRKRDEIGGHAYPFMLWAVVLMMLAEVAFTFYVGVYDLSNLVGHVFRVLAKMMIYIGVVRMVLIAPYLSLEKALEDKEQAKEQMRASRERFRNLIENTSDIVWETDLNLAYTYVSPKMSELLGHSSDDILGKTVLDFLPGREKQRIIDIAGSTIAERKAFTSLIVTIKTRSGALVTHEVSGVPAYDENGVLTGYRGISRDITERMESERRLILANTLIEASPTVLFRWRNAEGWPVDYVSDNIIQFGYTAVDLLSGRVPYASIVYPDDLERVGEEVSGFVAAGASHFTQEYRIVAKNGAVRWIDDRTTIERNMDGEVTFFQGIVIDITERREAEEALKKSQRDLAIKNEVSQIFLTSSSDALYVDLLEKLLLPAMHSPIGAFGYMAANGDLVLPSFIGHIWDECEIPGKSPNFPPETWGESNFGKAIRQKRTFSSNVPSQRTPEGHVRIDRHIATPIVFGGVTIGLLMVANKASDYHDGEIARIQDIANYIAPILQARLEGIRDDEARREAEARQKSQQEEMRLLVESSGEGIFAIDTDGRCTIMNQAAKEMLGDHSDMNFIGKRPEESFHLKPDGTDFYLFEESPSSYVIRTGQAVRLDQELFRRSDGTVITVYYHAYPMRRDGENTGAMILFRDITQELEAKRRERIGERMQTLGQLAGGVAHDLNNMLLPVLSLSDLVLKDTPESDERNRRRLEKVLEAGNRAKSLVSDILSFSRQDEAKAEKLDAYEEVEQAVGLLRETIPSTVSIREDLDKNTGTVVAAPSQINTILMNLAVNASQAIGLRTGAIDISLAPVELTQSEAAVIGRIPAGRYAKLVVADDGPGIPQAIVDKVFDPFFTTKEVGEGTGLGLSVVFGTVDKLKGAITVQSEEDRGAIFTVYLPLEDADAGKEGADDGV